MHGKKRAEYKARLRDSKTATGLEQKALQWHKLMKELQQRRVAAADNHDSDATATTSLALLEKALLVNPDPINLWNHRRQLLIQQLNQKVTPVDSSSTDSSNTDSIKDIGARKLLDAELSLTQASLQRNPKAYGAWFHRKWILQYTKPEKQVLQEELQLTKQFLTMDERNFHCWNYRRFVVACMAESWDGEWNVAVPNDPETPTICLMGAQVSIPNSLQSKSLIPPELINLEFEFTTTKIKDNFSNFSAFHYRSQLLELIEESIGDDKNTKAMHAVMENEFQLIEDAFCTEPDDQTSWWYQAILLDKIEADVDRFMSLRSRLEQQRDLLRELMEDSPGKWVALGLHRLLQVLELMGSGERSSATTGRCNDEQDQLLSRLIQLDPDRSNRYVELLQKEV